MKLEIHPNVVTSDITCSGCGSKFKLSGAFFERKFTVEQCSNCHSAYTGKRRTVETGAIEAFNKKFQGFGKITAAKVDKKD